MVEDKLRRKTTFSVRQPSMEDNLWWKATFGGRQLSVEDNPCMLPSPLCGIFLMQHDKIWIYDPPKEVFGFIQNIVKKVQSHITFRLKHKKGANSDWVLFMPTAPITTRGGQKIKKLDFELAN